MEFSFRARTCLIHILAREMINALEILILRKIKRLKMDLSVENVYKNAKDVLAGLGLPQELKEQQIQALRYIVQGQNLICSLPTGYGKSHIFAIAPFLFDRVRVLIVFMCINNDMYLFY
jgi:ATP-dependent helicase YprA (DUF1998 family)